LTVRAPSLELSSNLFLQYQPTLTRFIYSLVRDVHDAKDLSQEVAVYVLAHFADGPTDPSAFHAWCRSIAKNRVMHYWRSRQRIRDVPDEEILDLVDTAYLEADERAGVGAATRDLINCLERLSGPMREMLRLRYVEGLTSDAIGARLNRAAAGVRVTIMRARKLLEKCLDSDGHLGSKEAE
jgi:RNA polymerase sigma-70 factor (ECF subfamily)